LVGREGWCDRTMGKKGDKLKRTGSSSSFGKRKDKKETYKSVAVDEDDLSQELLKRLRECQRQLQAAHSREETLEIQLTQSNEKRKELQAEVKKLNKLVGLTDSPKFGGEGRKELRAKLLCAQEDLKALEESSAARVEQLTHLLTEAENRANVARGTATRALAQLDAVAEGGGDLQKQFAEQSLLVNRLEEELENCKAEVEEHTEVIVSLEEEHGRYISRHQKAVQISKAALAVFNTAKKEGVKLSPLLIGLVEQLQAIIQVSDEGRIIRGITPSAEDRRHVQKTGSVPSVGSQSGIIPKLSLKEAGAEEQYSPELPIQRRANSNREDDDDRPPRSPKDLDAIKLMAPCSDGKATEGEESLPSEHNVPQGMNPDAAGSATTDGESDGRAPIGGAALARRALQSGPEHSFSGDERVSNSAPEDERRVLTGSGNIPTRVMRANTSAGERLAQYAFPRISSGSLIQSPDEVLEMVVFEARGLPWFEVDPYCTCMLLDMERPVQDVPMQTLRLSQCNMSGDNGWNEVFVFALSNQAQKARLEVANLSLRLQMLSPASNASSPFVKRRKMVKKDVSNSQSPGDLDIVIGSVDIPLFNLRAGSHTDHWYSLEEIAPDGSEEDEAPVGVVKFAHSRGKPPAGERGVQFSALGKPPALPGAPQSSSGGGFEPMRRPPRVQSMMVEPASRLRTGTWGGGDAKPPAIPRPGGLERYQGKTKKKAKAKGRTVDVHLSLRIVHASKSVCSRPWYVHPQELPGGYREREEGSAADRQIGDAGTIAETVDHMKMVLLGGRSDDDWERDGSLQLEDLGTMTAVQKAASKLPPDLNHVLALLQNAMDEPDFDAHFVTAEGRNYAHLVAEAGAARVLRRLRRLGCNLRHIDADGFAPVHVAAASGNFLCLKALLDEDDSLVSLADEETGSTALHYAALFGHSQSASLIVTKGGKVDQVDESGASALSKAAFEGHKAVVKILIKNHNAKVHLPDTDDNTPFLLAALNGHFDTCMYIKKRMPSWIAGTVYWQNQRGDTPIWAAFIHDNMEFLRTLLSEEMPSQNSKSLSDEVYNSILGHHILGPYKFTLLHRILFHLDDSGRCHRLLKHLLACGLDPNARTLDGKTPLFYAAFKNRTACVSLLLQSGAEVAVQDTGGNTVLHFTRSAEVAAKIVSAFSGKKEAETVDIVNVVNLDGNSALHVAFAMSWTEMATFLLSQSAKADLENLNENTPEQCVWARSARVLLPFHCLDEGEQLSNSIQISKVKMQ